MADEALEKDIARLKKQIRGYKLQLDLHKEFIINLETNVDDDINKDKFRVESRNRQLDRSFAKYSKVHEEAVELSSKLEEDETLLELVQDNLVFSDTYDDIKYRFCKYLSSDLGVSFEVEGHENKLLPQNELKVVATGEFTNEIRVGMELNKQNETTIGSTIGEVHSQKHSSQFNAVNTLAETQTLHDSRRHDELSFVNSYNLPKITLPRFNGSSKDWLKFRDSFQRIIIDNKKVSLIEKFYYLDGVLDGEAKRVIERIEFSEFGFELAWQALLSRYNDIRSIVQTHMSDFFGLKSVKIDSANELQNLLDNSLIHVRALANLKEGLNDAVIIHNLRSKLDKSSLQVWENEIDSDENPSWEKMQQFLKKRIRVLKALNPDGISLSANSATGSSRNSALYSRPSQSKTFLSSSKQPFTPKCLICTESHFISNCPKFLKFDPKERFEKAKELRLCLNCLKLNHRVADCYGPRCSYCHGKHNKLLHLGSISSTEVHPITDATDTVIESEATEANMGTSSVTYHLNNKSCFGSQIVLSTAVILISDASGRFHSCRALLDSASMSNFITQELSEKLGFKKSRSSEIVSGLNDTTVNITHNIDTSIKSRLFKFGIDLKFLVVPQIATNLPISKIDIRNWPIPPGVEFADPQFFEPSSIDVLIGAEVYYQILRNGQYSMSNDLPTLQATSLGWIVGGKLNTTSYNFFISSTNLDPESTLDEQIEKFWTIDSLPDVMPQSIEEKQCEKQFNKSQKRTEAGRYVVDLPFKQNYDKLGDSRKMALKRFEYLESKLNKNVDLKEMYINFMRDYESLGHMVVCKEQEEECNSPEYFLPHHAVLRPESTSTKLRVVFDASSKTTSNLSLNDVLLVGPVVQPDLFSIILRFRLYQFVMTTDIQKMYRQINVNPDHAKYQKIFWRENVTDPIQIFKLMTVTYGTSPAPYLATKVLQQLSKDEEMTYPLAARATRNSFYVDDFLGGSNDLHEALQLQAELIDMFNTAGMSLRKWASNTPQLLDKIPLEHREKVDNTNETIKALGIKWNSCLDTFHFETSSELHCSDNKTKKFVLSCIAKLFDPLGLVSPIIVTAKAIMQQIWLSKIGWDDELPQEIRQRWEEFQATLSQIREIKIDRCIISKNVKIIEVHGFADASQIAYGACIYIRCLSENNVSVRLLCSKSRIAPLKITTIPRLELCAALLLVKLTNKVLVSLNIDIRHTILWTDSSIVLAWLKMPPAKLKLFVANRVSQIQELSHNISWRHVDSKNNAADLLSRGCLAPELKEQLSWFYGPQYLMQEEEYWPKQIFGKIEKIPEQKEPNADANMVFVTTKPLDIIHIEQFSSFTRLCRVTAYCLRYIRNLKHKDRTSRVFGPLNVEEILSARKTLIRIVQIDSFGEEIRQLKTKGVLARSSKILNLTPFLDSDELLRVGGRIKKSSFAFDEKHQYLLPIHHFSHLLIRYEHFKNYHSGVQQTLAAVRKSCWPVKGKVQVNQVIRNCTVCFRAKPKLLHQLLGDLPKSRIETCRPFHTTGLDFCGPFMVRYKNQRKDTFNKVYICIFICFTTKAVHLEVVEDLTADSFIACLKRFFNRRGRSACLWSDNGTNFVGAHNKLKEIQNLLQTNKHTISSFCTTEAVGWKFIPPRTPNFGGLWEAGVKVLKGHLRRIVGQKILTLEMIYTLVVEIEGIMNSRPLTELSNDPNDFDPLTPGHFLTGGALTSIVEPNLTHLPQNRLSQWRQITQMVQHFWQRFNHEYIQSLQIRKKCRLVTENLKLNDLVIVAEEGCPSMFWRMGRVIKVLPGADGLVRCAEIRTKQGIITRGISKLAKLPVNTESGSI